MKKKLKTSDFSYELPERFIASKPSQQRDRSRLLVMNRSNGTLHDRIFCELPELLCAGDLLVLNDTRVIPARFECIRKTGAKIEGLFLEQTQNGLWEVMLKNASRCKPGETLLLGGEVELEIIENKGKGNWLLKSACDMPAEEILERFGRTPLPPYILKLTGHRDENEDRRRYQTIYAAADKPGAVAAPTAGLHFTEKLFARLEEKNITRCYVTLHVGAGTFLPVKAEDLDRHEMHSEKYHLSAEAADMLNLAKAEGRRIVAVGTTCVRVLETCARQHKKFVPCSGATDIFIYPPAKFSAVDALITNFHLPQSTLLMLVSAFAAPGKTTGVEMLLNACRHAVENEYRFYSFGDAMLIQ